MHVHKGSALVLAGAIAGTGVGGVALAQNSPTVFTTTVLVQSEMCVGVDCDNSENLGSDTLRIKENLPRIHFMDTSGGNFPSTDWRIDINDNANGGPNYFAIANEDAAKQIFWIGGGAPEYALVVDDLGNVGIGAGLSPQASLHIVADANPALRLEQTGTTFSPRTWDIIGNHNAFSIIDRDGNGATPFQIAVNAPTTSLVVGSNGDIGIGALPSGASLDIRRDDGTAKLRVYEASTTRANNRVLMELSNKGAAQFALVDRDTGTDWRFQNFEDQFRVNKAGTGVTELTLDAAGNMTILGSLTQNSDRNAKMAVEPVDPALILEKVAVLPVAEWSYTDAAGVRHLGPMAQDFHALFGLGANDTGISTLDTSGVALAAIQALSARDAAQWVSAERQNAVLLARLAEQQDLIDALTDRIAALEAAD